MLDLFAGRLGWTRAFIARGWSVIAVDLVEPPDIPRGCEFIKADVLTLELVRPRLREFRILAPFGGYTFGADFICASSVCDGFASFGMPHFRKDPPFPENEIRLFNHTRKVCEAARIPYVMENVRTAQGFVGDAVNHCGPFYLWGSAVPPLLPQGISKAKWHRRPGKPGNFAEELNLPKKQRKAILATIPPELANCVADFANTVCH